MTARYHLTPRLRSFLVMLCVTAGLLLILVVSTHNSDAAPSPIQGRESYPVVSQTPPPGCTPAWEIVGSPNPEGGQSLLEAVTAVSPDDIWAVGVYTTESSSAARTLTLHWDGSQWTHVPSPNPNTNNWLKGVAAFGTNNVWTVGYQDDGNIEDLLILHWNGSQWNAVASPSPGGGFTRLYAVEAQSNEVWAVGTYYGGGPSQQSLTMRWDGSQWAIIPAPGYGEIHAVSATSANDIWAAGMRLPDGGPLALHWGGASWNEVTIPTIGPIKAVEAISPNDVWAITGMHAWHWNGVQWAQSSIPNPGGDVSLNGISAVSTSDIWVVGSYNDPTIHRALAIHWDGSQWSIVPASNPLPMSYDLLAVEAVITNDVWAVGLFSSSSGKSLSTLVERYSEVCLTPTTTNSATPTATIINTTTSTPVLTATVTSTNTSAPSSTVLPTSSPANTVTLEPCTITFSDVQDIDYFYEPVRYLYCLGVISGYADNTFRPWNNTTRGQLTKIVVLAEGWNLLNPADATFVDVAYGSTFYSHIETAVSHNIISGYRCGNPEPCDHENRPYFRPNADVTRGQLAKIIVLAQGWTLLNPQNARFADVGYGSTFYPHVETAVAHGIVSGYACGSPEPCDEQNRPYYRPGSSATRGQISKMVYNAITTP